MSKLMADTNGVIFSTLKHTDPHTVRGRSTQKDGVCNEHIFRNGSFREIKIAKESNDLANLAKVLPESYQKSNEFSRFSANRKCGQNVATDDRRTFTDKHKVRHIQTLGNDNKLDAMLDCESGFHQSEDKRKLNCQKLRLSYVTSILITIITFAMFLLKLSTSSAAIFLFVSLVLSLLCVYYIRMLCRHACFVSNNVVADECDHVVSDKAALCMDTLCIQQKCDESALCVQQIDVAREIKFRSRYMTFVYHCNINNPEYHVRRRFDREPSRIPVKKLGKLSHKNKKIKKLVYRRILKNIPVTSKMYRYIKCRLRARSNSDSIKFVQKMRKKLHSTQSTLHQKPTNCRESLSKYVSLFSCNTPSSVYKNASHRGHCVTLSLCNDIETNPGPCINDIDPTLTIKAPYSQGDIMYFGENAGKQCVAMSLVALIYNKIKGIHTCNDLVQILEIGNQLYSTLSQCTGQVYLMQTELPSMIAMSEKNYQLNYSESYTGNLHHSNSIIEGYQYSMSIDRAFESLLSQNYFSFILTIECICVSIYHTDNGSYKIFDSHARDEYGRSHPSGTCVLTLFKIFLPCLRPNSDF